MPGPPVRAGHGAARPRPRGGHGLPVAVGRRRGRAGGLAGAGRRPGAAAPRLPRAPGRPCRRRGEGRAAGAPHGILRGAGRHRSPALLTLHRRANAWFQLGGHLEPGDASLWAAARREAREESGIDALEPLPQPVQLDRHVLVGSFGSCREHLDVRYAAVAPPGVERRGSAPSRTTCAGGRSTRCPRAPAPSSRRWCHSRATPSVSADTTTSSASGAVVASSGPPSTGSSVSSCGGSPSACASPSRKPRARSRRG